MIVVVASAYDTRALRIVNHWGSQNAAILSAEDLCKPGWVLQVPRNHGMTAVVGGKTIPSAEIRGILTLRPCIFAEELQNIAPVHRAYVASELNAFVLAWLSAQSCPVLNPPTASSLAGPNWRPAQWALTAARLGIPIQIPPRAPGDGSPPDNCEGLEVTTVAERSFGCDDAVLIERTAKLAQAAGVDLLSTRFSAAGGAFLSASAWPSLTDPAILDAVHQRLAVSR